jgi:holo-[acyl-carrier protein] synthase
MIYGVGTDIVHIKRIEKIYNAHGERFIRRILSDGERARIPERNPHRFIAGRFAAKEAIFKAAGGKGAIGFKDIAILNDSAGRPFIEHAECIRELLPSRSGEGRLKVFISISHEREYALAVAIIEIHGQVI